MVGKPVCDTCLWHRDSFEGKGGEVLQDMCTVRMFRRFYESDPYADMAGYVPANRTCAGWEEETPDRVELLDAFIDYRRGWIVGAGFEPIMEGMSESFQNGYADGRQDYSRTLARMREQLGLPLVKKAGL